MCLPFSWFVLIRTNVTQALDSNCLYSAIYSLLALQNVIGHTFMLFVDPLHKNSCFKQLHIASQGISWSPSFPECSAVPPSFPFVEGKGEQLAVRKPLLPYSDH